MTADEIVSACLLLLLIVAAIWVHSRSKKIKRNALPPKTDIGTGTHNHSRRSSSASLAIFAAIRRALIKFHSFPNSGPVITKQQLRTIQRLYSLLSFACPEFAIMFDVHCGR
jgi:hypothetical protein